MGSAIPHILIVDDDESVREALAAALNGTYVIHEAATGEEAYAVLRCYPIAAIVLDVVLGQENGLDMIGGFRSISRAPILVLTGYASEELAIRALRLKVDDYLKKPPRIEELRATLARLVSYFPSAADPVRQARLHLDTHIQEQLDPKTLGIQLGFSERHVRRRFTARFGRTPRQYLTSTRMEAAVARLRTTGESVTQIARSLGYESRRTFSRVFRRVFGVSPSDLRR